MGLFDKMFGRGAASAQQDANAQKRFNELKGKYQSVLSLIEQQKVQLQNLHVQDQKLFIKGAAPSDSAKDAVWNQIKLVMQAMITILQPTSRLTPVKHSERQPEVDRARLAKVYEVKSGDNLSKISKQFYGDPNEYMRIF